MDCQNKLDVFGVFLYPTFPICVPADFGCVLFSGAMATISYALAFFIRNRFAVILLPFLSVLALHFGQYLLQDASSELSPIYLLGGYGFNTKMLWAVILELGVILVSTFLLALLKGGKDDVF